MNLALGRLPSDPRQPKLRLRRSPGMRRVAPASADWASAVQSWPMLLNDRIGCCTAVGAAHTAQKVDLYGQRRDDPATDAEVLAMYSAVSGYDPKTGANDVGATLADALKVWHQTGIGGNRIAAYAWIDHDDLDLVRKCIAVFGTVYTGFWVTEAAMNQFNRGQDWTATSRSRNLGGHCVAIHAYDQDWLTCSTWGRKQRMSTDFLLRWFDEIVVPIDLDWVTANGTSPAGLDIAALNRDYMALTGDPGPFQEIDTPDPEPGDADAALIAAFEAWRVAKGR